MEENRGEVFFVKNLSCIFQIFRGEERKGERSKIFLYLFLAFVKYWGDSNGRKNGFKIF